MKTFAFPRACGILFGLIGLLLLGVGCGDDSKTSGTMVQRSDEDLAHLKSKAKNYKGGAPQNKARAAARKDVGAKE